MTECTCPECNHKIVNNQCTNQYCYYKGPGWTQEQRSYAWSLHGEQERTTGAQYDYTGRE